MTSKLTLLEFQSVQIPKQEQIYLLDNDQLYYKFHYSLGDGIFRKLLSKVLFKVAGKPLPPTFSVPNENAILFLGFKDRSYDHFIGLESLLERIDKNNQYNYVLVFGKGDYSMNNLPFDPPDNLRAIFANNVNTTIDLLNYLPMGRDFRSQHLFENNYKRLKRDILCYCNFSINTHPVRQRVFELVRDKSFITTDHMGEFLDYPMSREDFYEKLGNSKFALCPRGNAIDTFRLWDCLYLGTIPIVVKEAVFHDELADLPILFLSSVEEISSLTPSFLEQEYEKMRDKKFNYQKLHLSHWLDKIQSALRK